MTHQITTSSSNGLVDLFRLKAETQAVKTILLENRERVPVGTLDLASINLSKLAICETTTVSERYYAYINGVTIFFTYWHII